MIRNIRQSPTYNCTKYNNTGTARVEYVHPHINIKESLKAQERMASDKYETIYSIGLRKDGKYWEKLDMEIEAIEIKHTRLPYYFNMLMPNPEYAEWNMVE